MVGSGTQTLGNGAVLVYSSTLVLHNSGVCSNQVVYAPTEDAEICLKDSLYKESNDFQSGLPAHAIKLVLGDFNARVGRETDAHPAPWCYKKKTHITQNPMITENGC